MRLEHHLVGGYVRYISPYIIIIIIIIIMIGLYRPKATNTLSLFKLFMIKNSIKFLFERQMHPFIDLFVSNRWGIIFNIFYSTFT